MEEEVHAGDRRRRQRDLLTGKPQRPGVASGLLHLVDHLDEHPGNFEIRKVSRNRGVRWKGKWLPVGHALIEDHLAFEQIVDGVWDVTTQA